MAGLVEKSLNAQSQSVKVLVDARSNSLVLSGEPEAVEAAAKVIQQLDTPGDVQPREMRVVELKQGDATAIAALATPLVAEVLKGQRGPEYVASVKIVADAAANRLIISGPHNEITAVNTIVEQLDQAPEGAGGAKVFKLNNATAIKVVNVVSNAMVKFDARNQPIRRVTVSADPESNSIVVAGTRADLKDAENIIQRLDNEGIDPSSLEKPNTKVLKVSSPMPISRLRCSAALMVVSFTGHPFLARTRLGAHVVPGKRSARQDSLADDRAVDDRLEAVGGALEREAMRNAGPQPACA